MNKNWINYWIKLPEHNDIMSEGYCGITNDWSRREDVHKISPYGKMKNILKEYKWENLEVVFVKSKLTQNEALNLEKKFRPTPNIGWNTLPGGPRSFAQSQMKGELHNTFGKPSKFRGVVGKAHFAYGKNNHSINHFYNIYDYKTKKLIAKNVVYVTWCRENNCNPGHLYSTSIGRLKQHKGFYMIKNKTIIKGKAIDSFDGSDE